MGITSVNPNNKIKHDIVMLVSQSLSTDKVVVEKIVDSFLKNLVKVVAEGNRVEIRGFAVIKPVMQKARPVRDFKNKKSIQLEPFIKPKVFVSPDFIKKCNNKAEPVNP